MKRSFGTEIDSTYLADSTERFHLLFTLQETPLASIRTPDQGRPCAGRGILSRVSRGWQDHEWQHQQ